MKFKKIENFVLIGFGEPLLYFYQQIILRKKNVLVVISYRHSKTNLPIFKKNFEKTLKQKKIIYVKIKDINNSKFFFKNVPGGKNTICICFGPAWIFNNEVINHFRGNIFNFNGIPLPKYLGGAHYTWQILNNDRSSGKFIQQITTDIDKGDVLEYSYKKLPVYARLPKDYFNINYNNSIKFLDCFLNKVLKEKDFNKMKFETINKKRFYFPRLITKKQAVINWSWSARHIKSFCNAFDDPYTGAHTFLLKKRVYLKKINLSNEKVNFHPFCSGLIIRKIKNSIWIATIDKLITTSDVFDDKGKNICKNLKEGFRFCSPVNNLNESLAFVPKITSRK